MTPAGRLTVGIVANEFFDRELGRMGGFGFAALAAARTFLDRPDFGIRPVFFSGEHRTRDGRASIRSNRIPLVLRDSDPATWTRRLRARRVDLLLLIDYRPYYEPILDALPDTPVLVWVRDPRPPEDDRKLQTLEIPGESAAQGIAPIDCSLTGVAAASAGRGRPLAFASPAPVALAPKTAGTYGVAADPLEALPNPLEVVSGRLPKATRPRVAFLARLDPVKRPWLLVELAERLPDVEFLMLGQPHFAGAGAGIDWLGELPPNLHALSHVEGVEKTRALASSWVLLNTSIHEAFPVSFMEALHCGVPIVSCQDPEGAVSRFGVFTGRWDGSGVEGLDAFEAGLRRLLDDGALRTRLGREARAWARANHTRPRFLRAFVRLADRLVPGWRER